MKRQYNGQDVFADFQAPPVGVEPTTDGLEVRCSIL